MTNIQDVVLKRFGVGAFTSIAKTKVTLRKIAGKGSKISENNFQTGFTVPRDVFNPEDLGHKYIVIRDTEGNYIFKKTNEVDNIIVQRYC